MKIKVISFSIFILLSINLFYFDVRLTSEQSQWNAGGVPNSWVNRGKDLRKEYAHLAEKKRTGIEEYSVYRFESPWFENILTPKKKGVCILYELNGVIHIRKLNEYLSRK